MKTLIVIPERYESTRFPGKPLVLLGEKPLVLWACEAAEKSKSADEVIVATDDARIKDVVEQAGFTAVMTSKKHVSGTDRVSEVVFKKECDIVVNLQGDEPFMKPEIIDALINRLSGDHSVQIATAAVEIRDEKEAADTNIVKVVVDKNNYAMYFSRSMIPFYRDMSADKRWLKHLGIYCMRKSFLGDFVKMKHSGLEGIEKLEQLRILESGNDIYVEKVDYSGLGVDTPEDLKKAEQFILNR
ncbi:MAG: 3-deoxy-manno-octulosonate cytidylyltransferase [Candidatus Aureabacteria bacterium]|nr:3-deoxy-manno-octulosonate cytidylyltransferase [Candidatus Auribacterota bacterium]